MHAILIRPASAGIPRTGATLFAALALATLLAGCSPRQMIVGSLADELAAQGRAGEEDLELARDAGAFYLKLSEALLREQPGHRRLAEAVAGGFTQYAYAFVAFEADRIEARDSRAADALRQRAARLYRRAQRHAMAALELERPGFAAALAAADPAAWPRLQPEQAGLAYWAAASWGAAISLSKDDPDTVADLPLAIRLAELAWAADPEWGQGALTGLLGSFEAARPGGSARRALAYFDRSIEQGGGRSAGPLLAKAEGHALPAGDRPEFERLLRQALAIREQPDSPEASRNEIMRRRARWLLEKADDLF